EGRRLDAAVGFFVARRVRDQLDEGAEVAGTGVGGDFVAAFLAAVDGDRTVFTPRSAGSDDRVRFARAVAADLVAGRVRAHLDPGFGGLADRVGDDEV